MKLYRGIKTRKFELIDQEFIYNYNSNWNKILELRSNSMEYPDELNSLILKLEKQSRLLKQNFTDRKEIAERYAQENGGLLISIDVPNNEIIKFFTLEFQNFSKRKDLFEIVYTVDAIVLNENKSNWSLQSNQY